MVTVGVSSTLSLQLRSVRKKRMGPFYRVLFIVACRHIAINKIVWSRTPDDEVIHSPAPNGAKKISYALLELQP